MLNVFFLFLLYCRLAQMNSVNTIPSGYVKSLTACQWPDGKQPPFHCMQLDSLISIGPKFTQWQVPTKNVNNETEFLFIYYITLH